MMTPLGARGEYRSDVLVSDCLENVYRNKTNLFDSKSMAIPGSQEPDCKESKDLGCSLNSLYKMTASLDTGRLDVFDRPRTPLST